MDSFSLNDKSLARVRRNFRFSDFELGITARKRRRKKVGLVVLIFAAEATVPVYLTGEPAEEVIENLPGVARQIIERQESSALYSLIATIFTGVFALFGLIFTKLASAGVIQRVLIFAALVLSFGTVGLMSWTANLGGQIRHTEIRADAQTNAPASDNTENEKEDDH